MCEGSEATPIIMSDGGGKPWGDWALAPSAPSPIPNDSDGSWVTTWCRLLFLGGDGIDGHDGPAVGAAVPMPGPSPSPLTGSSGATHGSKSVFLGSISTNTGNVCEIYHLPPSLAIQHLARGAVHNAIGARSARERHCTSYFARIAGLACDGCSSGWPR